VEICVFLDTHDRRKAKGALVQRLTKVGSEHTRQDAPVDSPEQFLVCLIVNLDRGILGVVGSLEFRD
jgi:hypothetical protein